ncbi:hypothetical protein [Endozoicomonas ascidiicola]|uniref:hypothetical protein n=1 Tax=Endozoicomonas ascidiicola TaxID=1698521 RepID=UPI00082AE30D|nr:hypothetical protein [Endozoicomonas ascidiicola]
MQSDTYKICVMIPTGFVNAVKDAMFAAGAGHYDNYDQCCWETAGTGQFRALPGSQPFSGSQGVVHQEETWKVELICHQKYLEQVIEALRHAHPYEVPAFDITPVFLTYPSAPQVD